MYGNSLQDTLYTASFRESELGKRLSSLGGAARGLTDCAT